MYIFNGKLVIKMYWKLQIIVDDIKSIYKNYRFLLIFINIEKEI